MKRINKLDILTANKIAAGEVVDRPASIIKELIENSIDAGATSIIVEIKEGGKNYIRITDNGIGIHPEDVEIAFERHATSKISKIEDLNKILSLGFRGEALASIAAVSQMELITKYKDANEGVYVELHGGKVIKNHEIGCPQGTTMIVKNLFYNTPARFKFMKAKGVETSHISDILSKYALAYSHISFRFINNGNIVFTTSGSSNIINNIASIYGKEIAQNMYPINDKNKSLSLEGYISKPFISRGNKQLQVFFVNGRYVKSKIMSSAIEEAYKTLVMVNKFPICFIYLNVPPEDLDVNIHPTKTEIKFHQEEEIKNFIIDSIKKKLYKEDLTHKVTLDNRKEELLEQKSILDLTIPPIKERVDIPVQGAIGEDKSKYIANNKKVNDVIPKERPKKEILIENKEKNHQEIKKVLETKNKSKIHDIKIVGQIFNTYLIGQGPDGLYLIDQHAAHERIIYDELANKYKNQGVITQNLLVPMVIELSFGEFEMVKNNMDIFKNLGFDIEVFGVNSFIIRSVPMVFGEPEAKKFFIEVADQLEKGIENSYELKMDKIISMACKQAIKGHDPLDQREIDELMKQLSKLENPFTCPHGRPVIITISQYEIEKKFRRV